MAGRTGLTPGTPGGTGELVSAEELLRRFRDDRPSLYGRAIQLNPGGGEYTASLIGVLRHAGLAGWIELRHHRPELERATTNVVPPSTKVRLLD